MKMPKMPNVEKMFKKLCNPAKLYLVLSAFSLLFYMISFSSYGRELNHIHAMGVEADHHTYMGLMMHIVWVILWTSVLNYICHKFPKHGTTISWVLVVLPFVLFAMFLFFTLFVLSHVEATAASQQVHANMMQGLQESMGEQLGQVHSNTMDHQASLEYNQNTLEDQQDTLEDIHQNTLDNQVALNALHKPSHPVIEHAAHDPNEGHHAPHESHGDSLFGFL
tara:strand:+ start:1279 stop:1944 length:666 start_codon:yes stop_codon:yes gene_type:complete